MLINSLYCNIYSLSIRLSPECANAKQQEHIWAQLLLNLTNFFVLPVIRTQLTTYRARLSVLVLVVYLKPEAENTKNLTNKTT